MLLTGLLCFLKCTMCNFSESTMFQFLMGREPVKASTVLINWVDLCINWNSKFLWKIFQLSRAKCSSYNISEHNLLALEIKLLLTLNCLNQLREHKIELSSRRDQAAVVWCQRRQPSASQVHWRQFRQLKWQPSALKTSTVSNTSAPSALKLPGLSSPYHPALLSERLAQ